MDIYGDVAEPPDLIGVLAFSGSSEFEGGRLWVTAVERWRSGTALQFVVWRKESDFGQLGHQSNDWSSYVVSLADDLDTPYAFAGGGSGTGGRGHVIRGNAEFQTAIPGAARSLVATLHRMKHGTPDDQVLTTITLDL